MKCIFILLICLLQSLRFDVAGNKPPVLKQFFSYGDELQAIIVKFCCFGLKSFQSIKYVKCLFYTFHEQMFFALKSCNAPFYF